MAFAEALKPSCQNDLHSLHQQAVASTMEAAISALHILKGISPPASTDGELSRALSACFGRAMAGESAESISAEVGAALEQLRGRRLAADSYDVLRIETSPEQRSRGVYYTPPNLADTMVRSALKSLIGEINSIQALREIAILDPAVGGGAFLLSALRITVELLEQNPVFVHMGKTALRREVASHCLYGVDIDPVAIATVRALLVAEVGAEDWSVDELDKHLHIGDSVGVNRSDWGKWFPARAELGFNVIVTNPPWSKLRPLRHEFFEHIDSSVRLLQGKALGDYLKSHMSELIHGDWEQYVNRTMDLSNRLRSSKEYVVNDSAYGDPDLYKFFLERCIVLLAPKGIAALLLPSGVLRAQGSAPLRRLMREEGSITEIVEYINKRKIFDIHSMYRFASILFKKGTSDERALARFGVTDPASESIEQELYLESDFLDLVGGVDSLIPEVRSDAERNLLARLYREHPVSKGIGGAQLSFKRELDMTNDAANFIQASDARLRGFQPSADGRWLSKYSRDVLLPVYEGRMVHQYDHTAKQYCSGDGRSAKWESPVPGKGTISPHFFVTEEYALSRNWQPVERVGYCEISGHANERTVLAALIPAFAVCGNKVPVLRSESAQQSKLWLAFSNSLAVDWVIRRWVSTTINQFYWRNIPFPVGLSSADQALVIKMVELLSCASGGATKPAVWLGRRAQLRAAIDAVVMNAYNITPAERETILKDFPIFTKAAFPGDERFIPVGALLEMYIEAHLKGVLSVETVHTICKSECCAAAYSTRSQKEWLN